MKIVFCPWRQLAQRVAGEEAHTAAVLSSSTEPEASRLPKISYVFRQYEDLDYECYGRSFSSEDAKAFADYVKGMANVDTLYCCCDAGESRSPAVAAAVMRYLGMDDMAVWRNPHYHPNMLVFAMLMDAVNLSISDEEKDYLLYTNQKAFRDAIRK